MIFKTRGICGVCAAVGRQASIGRRGKLNAGNVTSPLLNSCLPPASPAVLLLLIHCAVHPAHAGNVKCGPGISLQHHPAVFLCLPHVLFGWDPNSQEKSSNQFHIHYCECAMQRPETIESTLRFNQEYLSAARRRGAVVKNLSEQPTPRGAA